MTTQFTDINSNFYTNDGIVTEDSFESINNSINNIIFTSKGEKVGDPNFGTGINSLLFDQMSLITENLIESEVRDAINFYERRVSLDAVDVVSNYDTNSYSINIIYTILTLPDAKEKYVTILKRL